MIRFGKVDLRKAGGIAILTGVGTAAFFLAKSKAEEKLGRVKLPMVTESVHEDKVTMARLKHFCDAVPHPDRNPMARNVVLYTDRIYHRYKATAKLNPKKVIHEDAVYVATHIDLIHDCVQELVAVLRVRDVERSTEVVRAYEALRPYLNKYLMAIVNAGVRNFSITNEHICAKERRAMLRRKKNAEHRKSVSGVGGGTKPLSTSAKNTKSQKTKSK